MKLKRLTALLLCAVMLALPLASCGDGSEATTTSGKSEGTTDVWINDNLDKSLDNAYKGEKIRILARADDWFFDEISLKPDEVMNIIDESVVERENYVEERLGLELEVQKELCGKEYDKLADMTRTYFESNTDVFDILAGPCYHVMQLTTEGVMWDLNEVENIELSQPWYAQNFIDLSTINDMTFFVAGDATLSLMRFAFVTFVNLDQAKIWGVPDIYQTVDDKQWTVDYLHQTVTNIYSDANGSGVSDAGDIYGFATSPVTGVDLFWSSFDIDILGHNDAGALEVTIDTDKAESAVNKLCDLFYINGGVRVEPFISGDGEYEVMMSSFASDLYVFTNLRLISVESQNFIDMESKYGIIPTPMWSADQESYQTYVHDLYTVLGITGTVSEERLPMVGAFLEAYSCYSYNMTRDVYFETALKGRYARDEASRRMLDVIVDNVTIDAGWIYSYCLGDFALIIRDLVKANNRNWGSSYRVKGMILTNKLKTLNEDFGG